MNTGQHFLFATFFIYLLILLIIGWFAWRNTHNLADYILGGRKLGRWTAALSAGASDMSGWLLLGLPGFAYLAGFEAIWIAIGLLIGTSLNWWLVAPRLREYSVIKNNALTLPEFFEYHFNDQSHSLRLISAVCILFFYVFYTSSGLVAGGKLFESVFGLPYHWAVFAGTLAILIYTVFGGFLAVCWTDLFQGLLMFLALVFVAFGSLKLAGGWDITLATMRIVDPSLLDLWHTTNMQPLTIITISSLLGWGLGYFGQPHILTRFMAIDSVKNISSARWIAILWTGICLIAAITVGFTGIAVLETPLTGSNVEKVYIELIAYILHPVPAGICLAAILAAIMSTADSQLLVASSAVTEDIYRTFIKQNASQKDLVNMGRSTVIITALLAMWMAMEYEQNVLELVAYAWAGFGAAFGPALLLVLYWKGCTCRGAIAGIITGGLTVILWHKQAGGIFDLYELIPGFLLAALANIFVSYLDRPGNKSAPLNSSATY
jgi:sodium/proline symporter